MLQEKGLTQIGTIGIRMYKLVLTWLTLRMLYTLCPRKKRPKRFFCNIAYKTRANLVKFDTLFPE